MATFTTIGEMHTKRARDLWASKDFSKAKAYLMDGIEGMTLDYLVPIINGSKKLSGVNPD